MTSIAELETRYDELRFDPDRREECRRVVDQLLDAYAQRDPMISTTTPQLRTSHEGDVDRDEVRRSEFGAGAQIARIVRFVSEHGAAIPEGLTDDVCELVDHLGDTWTYDQLALACRQHLADHGLIAEYNDHDVDREIDRATFSGWLALSRSEAAA